MQETSLIFFPKTWVQFYFEFVSPTIISVAWGVSPPTSWHRWGAHCWEACQGPSGPVVGCLGYKALQEAGCTRPLLSRGPTAPSGSPSRKWGLGTRYGTLNPLFLPCLVVLLLFLLFSQPMEALFWLWEKPSSLSAFSTPFHPYSDPPACSACSRLLDSRLFLDEPKHPCASGPSPLAPPEAFFSWNPCGSIQCHPLREASLTTLRENTLSTPPLPPTQNSLLPLPCFIYLHSIITTWQMMYLFGFLFIICLLIRI